MLQALFRIRYMVLLAVVVALLGALLLILLGGWHTIIVAIAISLKLVYSERILGAWPDSTQVETR